MKLNDDKVYRAVIEAKRLMQELHLDLYEAAAEAGSRHRLNSRERAELAAQLRRFAEVDYNY